MVANPSCAGCHQTLDPLGSFLPAFDNNLLVGRVYRCREADAVLYSLEFVAEPFVRASFKQALRLAGTQAKQVREHWQDEVAR